MADMRFLNDAASDVVCLSECCYDKIPRVFTGLDDWPFGTNLHCWMCDFTFDARPKFVPTYVSENENGGIEFGVHGNMCTFSCVELWIEKKYGGGVNEAERWRLQDNLRLLYFYFTGRTVSQIKPAYEKTMLKQYGGEWDEDTFWERMRSLDPTVSLKDHTDPVIPERYRTGEIVAQLRTKNGIGPTPVDRAMTKYSTAPNGSRLCDRKQGSIWALCGLEDPLADPAAEAADPAAEKIPQRADNVPLADDYMSDLLDVPGDTTLDDASMDDLLREIEAL